MAVRTFRPVAPLVLVLAGTACQPATQPAAAPARPLPAADSAATAWVPSVPASYPPPVCFTAADTLARPLLALLRQHDLARLWCSADRPQEPTLEGFFGPGHYRFTMVIASARRDARRPDVYRVQGKCRYHEKVQPFAGTLTIRRVAATRFRYSLLASELVWPDESAPAAARPPGQLALCYTVLAQLQLVETGVAHPATLEGEGRLACYLGPHGASGYVPAKDEDEPNWRSSLLLRGAYRYGMAHPPDSFAVADNVLALAPSFYRDFVQGARGVDINPKYARLGWATYWENDEWWAEPARRHPGTLSLHPLLLQPPTLEPDSGNAP